VSSSTDDAADVTRRVALVISAAQGSLRALAAAPPGSVVDFFRRAASLLADSSVLDEVRDANRSDVASAQGRGRAVGRLVFDDRMLAAMIEGLGQLAEVGDRRDEVLEMHRHEGFRVEVRRAPLGVVGFVFEGRPNVLVDATGVLSVGNAAVLRIGSDALGTAIALHRNVVAPALRGAGLPEAAVTLLAEPGHAAGRALFADPRIALAVARGSGPAVRELGDVARSHGIPVSLHGTGGAWMLVDSSADHVRLEGIVRASLDRKVCNTLNVCCIPRSDAARLLPAVLRGATHAATGGRPIVHASAEVREAAGDEHDVEWVPVAPLATEWEWDSIPEFTVLIVEDLDEAVASCNEHSPRFVVSVVGDADRVAWAWNALDAPFVGDGITRWVDGQYALGRPELGLSNWEHGRALGRGSILSGVDVHSVRYRMFQDDPGLTR